ncbi:RNA polymerase sigma24 factor [Longispora fulva]|nr:SigE family RNA polymerase sigma factor [Longispora fulva]GIG60011.1 RNA polymerase sigma24 factor [Longispora fulva]
MADADEFDVFFRQTGQRVLRYAYGLTGDRAEAQDLTQEAYARAWERWSRVRGYDDPEAWLRLVVTRLSTDRWRRLRVRWAAASASRPPEQAPPPSEDTMVLVAALRHLPATHRQVIVLHYLLDRSVADIATEIGKGAGTVKSWLARGRAGLAAQLAETPHETTTGGSDVR